MLHRKIKNQFYLSLIQFIICTILIVLIIFVCILTIKFTNKNGKLHFEKIHSQTAIYLHRTCIGLSIIGDIIWIVAIWNSIKIHEITKKSIWLIMMSVLVLWFGQLWASIIEWKRYNKTVFQNEDYDSIDTKENSLKKAFMDGVISSDEYKEKLGKITNEAN